MFKRIAFKRTALLSFAVCFTLFFLCLPSAMSLDELDEYSAACPDECCNPTGGPDCEGDGDSKCKEIYWAYGEGGLERCPEGYDCTGYICDESTHEWAESGADDADCDSAWLMLGQQSCTMSSTKIFCSQYKQVDCDTEHYDLVVPPGEPGPSMREYYCEENDEEYIAKYNNSREQCYGDPCSW